MQDLICKQLYKGKVVIIYGPRRVGKTTLSKEIIKSEKKSGYINCELLENKVMLEGTTSSGLKGFLGPYKLVVLDEAQYIKDIGHVLKVLVDTFPEIQIIATGSSGFDLGNKINEPLTGRSREYLMLPFSISELLQKEDRLQLSGKLEWILRFGMYPEVYGKTDEEAIEELSNIAGNYLFKDIFQLELIKRPELLRNLLVALALQIGQEANLNELSRLLGETIPTIKRYLSLLEQSYIIFRLGSFSRNLRKEIAKGQKFYFYDVGIRNFILRNFNPMQLRNDIGGLWENFCLAERMKLNNNKRRFVNNWFWRTYDQKEIDYIEEYDGALNAFEFKFKQVKVQEAPKDFVDNYSDITYRIINRENFWDFIGASLL